MSSLVMQWCLHEWRSNEQLYNVQIGTYDFCSSSGKEEGIAGVRICREAEVEEEEEPLEEVEMGDV